MTLDAAAIRSDFPVLEREVNGRPLVFLDSAASSQKPRQVVEAMSEYYYRHHANVHRGAHVLSVEATALYEEARAAVAAFVGADPSGLVFVRNATEAVNLVAASWGRTHLEAGDEVVVSVAEHHANIVPWQMVAAETGAVVRPVGIDGAGRIDLGALRDALSPRTRLVATFHVSNVLGSVNPVAEVAELAHAAGALLFVDGAQAAPHLPVDVAALGCDFYAFSAHKMLGPTGIGALWARPELLAGMPPYMGGGEMISRVTFEGTTYAPPPKRFEAGTPSIAEAVGFAAAVRYLEAVGMDAVRRHDEALVARALERLRGMPGVTLVGPEEGRVGLVTFVVDGVHAHDVATALDLHGVAVRAGQHCAQPLHRELGIAASTRASFYLYNEPAEVDAFADALAAVLAHFAAFA
ncbi:MAG TPA: SufS family cysteine desulfurase [Trueperaceae bacterium]|nr:SufS family cysteine desulfurase [Trueperaceae bacterium]